MAKSHTEQVRSDLAEIRKHVEQCRRELGIDDAPRTVRALKGRRGGLLRGLRAPRRQAPLA